MSNFEQQSIHPTEKKKYEKPKLVKHPEKQHKIPFKTFLDFIDQNAERQKPNPEQIKNMDRRLVDLGKLFSGSDIQWHLDGAFNISLIKPDQKYIGIHKDVDISVEKDDLDKLDKLLIKKGYGLFLSHELEREEENKEDNLNLERVDSKKAAEGSAHITIAAIDKQGKVQTDKTLNFLDVHLIERDKQGKPLGFNNTVLPEDWVKPTKIEFKEQELNISNPAKVLYYKLHQSRNYDVTDSLTLIDSGMVTEKQMKELDQVINSEINLRLKILGDVVREIAPNIKEGMTPKEIYAVLLRDPLIAEKAETAEKSFKQICQLIAELPDKSEEKINNIFLHILKIDDAHKKMLDKLKVLENKFEDTEKIKKIRQKL